VHGGRGYTSLRRFCWKEKIMIGKIFTVMQTNVGNMIHDTTADTAVLIGVWINDAYQDAWRRFYWADIIDEDFTFDSVASLADYPFDDDGESGEMNITDFGKELGVWDIANGHEVKRYTIKNWWEKRGPNYNADSLDDGNPLRYVILPESGKLRLDPPPDTAETYAMPYQKAVTDLATTNTPAITTISTYLEFYSMGMGFAYKKEYDAAVWWGNKAEMELAKLIKEENIKLNQKFQRKLPGFTANAAGYLLGEKSYDTV